MTQYYWYSEEAVADKKGQTLTDRDNKTHQDQGYAIVMDIRTQEFYPFNHISVVNRPEKESKTSDIQKVLIIDYPHEVDVAVDRKGQLSKMAQNFCKAKGFPVTKESIEALTQKVKPVRRPKEFITGK